MRKLSAFAQEKGSHLPARSQINTQTHPLPSWALAPDTPLTGLIASVPLRPRERNCPQASLSSPVHCRAGVPRGGLKAPLSHSTAAHSRAPGLAQQRPGCGSPCRKGSPQPRRGEVLTPDRARGQKDATTSPVPWETLLSPMGDPPVPKWETPLPAPLSSTPFQPTPGQGRRGPLQPLVGLEDSLPFSHCFYPPAVPFLLGSAQCRLPQEASLDHPRSL